MNDDASRGDRAMLPAPTHDLARARRDASPDRLALLGFGVGSGYGGVDRPVVNFIDRAAAPVDDPGER